MAHCRPWDALCGAKAGLKAPLAIQRRPRFSDKWGVLSGNPNYKIADQITDQAESAQVDQNFLFVNRFYKTT